MDGKTYIALVRSTGNALVPVAVDEGNFRTGEAYSISFVTALGTIANNAEEAVYGVMFHVLARRADQGGNCGDAWHTKAVEAGYKASGCGIAGRGMHTTEEVFACHTAHANRVAKMPASWLPGAVASVPVLAPVAAITASATIEPTSATVQPDTAATERAAIDAATARNAARSGGTRGKALRR